MSAAPTNRVFDYLAAPKRSTPKTRLSLPTTPADRERVLTDAVFAAIQAVQGLLTSDDPKVVLQAAGMILDLDKTQMRHNTRVAGTHAADLEPLPPVVRVKPVASPTPPPAPKAEPPRDLSNPLVRFILGVQKRLQAELVAEGHGEVIPWEEAEEVALEEIKKERIRRDKLRGQETARSPKPPQSPGAPRPELGLSTPCLAGM